MFAIDDSTDFGARALSRLQNDIIIWLIVVDETNTPRPTPVWFIWDGEQIVIYSQPNQLKIRSIEANPRVSLHFNSDEQGGNIVVLTGNARVAPEMPEPKEIPAYVEKYSQVIAAMGADPDQMSATFSTAIVVTPDRLSGH
jgi:PPOX class probable F420-dependent enzyme